MSGLAQIWPEQNAIEEWWRAHSYELKQAATSHRIALEERLERKEEAIANAMSLIELLRRDGLLQGNHYGALKATLEAGD